MSVLTSPTPTVPLLETTRLLLRGYRADDFDPWIAMWQDPNYYRYLSPEPLPTEEVWRTLLRSAGHWVVMGFGFWAIEVKATGEFIGAVGYLDGKRTIEPPLGDAPEMGWVLDPAVHGLGYAREAAEAALAWAKNYFGPVRMVCIIHPDNEASLRLADKIGYREYARSTYHNDPIVLLERPAQP